MKTFLLILGILLLLPGLCGVFFLGMVTPAIIEFFSSSKSLHYDALVVMFAVPGVLAGCLGIYTLVHSERMPAPINRIANLAACILSIVVIVLCVAVFAGDMRTEDFEGWFIFFLLLVIAVAAVPLPLILQWRKLR